MRVVDRWEFSCWCRWLFGIFWPVVFTNIVNSNGVDKDSSDPDDEEEDDTP